MRPRSRRGLFVEVYMDASLGSYTLPVVEKLKLGNSGGGGGVIAVACVTAIVI